MSSTCRRTATLDEPGHTGGCIAFGPDGNLYLGTGRQHQPVRLGSGYAPIDERPGRRSLDAQRTAGNTNDLRGKLLRIHPEADGTYTVPTGNLFAPGHRARPGRRSTRWASATRSASASTRRPAAVWWPTTARTRGAANPNRGPEGTVEWNLIKQPGNYGWPYCVGNNIPYNDYNFATTTSGAKFNCAAPVNDSPNNTGLTNLPAGRSRDRLVRLRRLRRSSPRSAAAAAAPMGGPVYRYDAGPAARPQVARPTTTARRSSASGTELKMYTLRSSAPPATPGRHQPASDRLQLQQARWTSSSVRTARCT